MPDTRHRLVWRSVWLAGAVLATAASAAAAPADKTYHFFSAGYGKRTCYDYLAASEGFEASKYTSKTLDQHAFVSENAAFDQWIYGYFSAMNFDSAVGGNKRADVEAHTPEIISWTREWCRTRPNAVVFEGIRQFMNDQWARLKAPPQVAGQSAPQQGTDADPMFVSVTFQSDVSADDKTAFLQAYSVVVADGPNADGAYKLRLSAPLPQDQLEQVLSSMRSQAKVIKSAGPD